MIIDDRRLIPTENNLTLTRLVLASAVIWTHSVWRVSGIEGRDELSGWLGTPISSFAVDGFFFLSGFLVYASLLRRTPGDFVAARLARLWPGLAVAVLAMVAAGALVTRTPGLGYIRDDTFRFIVDNLTLVAGRYTLTGIECAGGPCNINGSLWTITWEVRCYLVLAALSLVGLAMPLMMKRVILPGSLAFALLMHVPPVTRVIEAHGGHGLLYNLVVWDRLWSMFALGIAAYLWRGHLRLSWTVCLLLLGAVLVSQRWFPVPHLPGLFTGYAVLCAGFLSARDGAVSGRWPDYSYGMYIYAFPVMMALAAMLPITTHPVLAAATFAATLPLAALSWHRVEKPVLELVRSRRLRRRKSGEGPTGKAVATDV